jgi:hypothetical protein
MSLRSHEQGIGLTTGELTILRVLLENRGQFVKTKTRWIVELNLREPQEHVHGAVRQLRRTLNDVELIRPLDRKATASWVTLPDSE